MTILQASPRTCNPSAQAFALGYPAENRRFDFQSAAIPTDLTEKYRPITLADIVGQGAAVEQLQEFVETPYSTSFLLSGGTGVGKTTAAKCLAADLGCDPFWGVMELDSGKQNLENVEAALKFLRQSCMGGGSGWKVVIVNEADGMSDASAKVFLSALEAISAGYDKSVVIFTTNYPDKMGDRFKHRCTHIEFGSTAAPMLQDVDVMIGRVWEGERAPGSPPRASDLKGLVDTNGNLSIRLAVRIITPMIAAAKRGKPFQPPARESDPVAPSPTPPVVSIAPCAPPVETTPEPCVKPKKKRGPRIGKALASIAALGDLTPVLPQVELEIPAEIIPPPAIDEPRNESPQSRGWVLLNWYPAEVLARPMANPPAATKTPVGHYASYRTYMAIERRIERDRKRSARLARKTEALNDASGHAYRDGWIIPLSGMPEVDLTPVMGEADDESDPSIVTLDSVSDVAETIPPVDSSQAQTDATTETEQDQTIMSTETGFEIDIRGSVYHAIPYPPRYDEKLRAYRLEKNGSDYDVAETLSGRVVCTCPDFRARHADLPDSLCKHGQALVSAGMLAQRTETPQEAVAPVASATTPVSGNTPPLVKTAAAAIDNGKLDDLENEMELLLVRRAQLRIETEHNERLIAVLEKEIMVAMNANGGKD